ncbi:hypothetical protein [Bacillus clarus]|uniref:Putative membrane protein n=1 Tax=Bacillus clarus TaxID=2338372 RepID=A0A090Z3M4_9BACI|nr:hypothetical protein [Bacillus clarus]KFM98985.1 putative membrane protein [Bacillus clarus]
MREYFGFISMFLTSIVFFGYLSGHGNGYLIYLIPISIVLAIFAPRGDTAKKITFAILIILGILIACALIIGAIIGAGLAESQLKHLK